MGIRTLGTLLTCLTLGVGCNRGEPAPTSEVRPTDIAPASDTPIRTESQTAHDLPRTISTVPVTSKELTGVWFGVAPDTGVVVQFIGRQSRESDQRGVLSGKWVVHVDRGSISSSIQFTDNVETGAVDLTVGLVNNETNRVFTADLGRVERSSDEVLYLSIYKNQTEDMYVPADRIRLQRIDDQDVIDRTAIDQMREALKQMQSAHHSVITRADNVHV